MVSGRREAQAGQPGRAGPAGRPWRLLQRRRLGSAARVSRNSATARRTIMPRFAFSPVWLSSRSIYRSNCRQQVHRQTEVDDGGGRPAWATGFFLRGAGGAGLRPAPFLGVPWGRAGLRGMMDVLLHRVVGPREIYYTT